MTKFAYTSSFVPWKVVFVSSVIVAEERTCRDGCDADGFWTSVHFHHGNIIFYDSCNKVLFEG